MLQHQYPSHSRTDTLQLLTKNNSHLPVLVFVNMELADCMPLAIANLYKQPIRIYSSMVSNSVYDIYPDLQDADNSLEFIKVALFAITGQEHYEAVCHLDKVPSSPSHSEQASADGYKD
jgi:carbohydrate-binding DOMON domain-containing protein